MSKSKFDKLGDLFDLLCDDFERMIKSGEMSHQDRKTLMEFLKVNDVTATPTENDGLNRLINQLPFKDDQYKDVMN